MLTPETLEVEDVAVPLAAMNLGAGAAATGGAGAVAAADGEEELDGAGLEEEELIGVEEEEVPLAVVDLDDEDGAEEELVSIDDEEAPKANLDLADGPAKHGYWWSIIPLVVAGITGKTVYDKKNKKGIFAEKEATDNPDKN